MADALKVPAHVRPYVDALGLQLAARFLMEFGGSVGYLSVNPRQDAEIARFLGREMTIALARSVGEGRVAVQQRIHWARRGGRLNKPTMIT